MGAHACDPHSRAHVELQFGRLLLVGVVVVVAVVVECSFRLTNTQANGGPFCLLEQAGGRASERVSEQEIELVPFALARFRKLKREIRAARVMGKESE